MPEIKKQLPLVTESNKAFWEAARRHELAAYKCRSCGALCTREAACAACGADGGEWVKVSGRGEVFTFCVYRQSFHPAWRDDVPYNAAYVKLAEGPLLMTNIVGCENKDIYIGMAVEVTFDDITPEVTLPRFRPAGINKSEYQNSNEGRK
ncbi:MAG: OB-fold domain-containing protein [Dehalococcoidales bacterium]|jgi:hypothetical protein